MHRIVIFLVLSSILCSVNAIGLTYPIKGTYLGWQGRSWADPPSPIIAAADAGYNLLIFTFYSDMANDMVESWDGIPLATRQSHIDYIHSKQTAMLLGVWIMKQYGDLINVENATDLGIKLAGEVTSRGFDGIDLMIREMNAGFGIGSKNSNDSVTWVVDLTIALRSALGPDAIITFSPLATDFGPINGNGWIGPLGGYTSVHPRISHLIQHYNVFFWDAGPYCFVDYNSLFVQSPSSCPFNSVSEISANAHIDLSQLVVAKVKQSMYASSGYMTPAALKSSFSTAYTNLGWNAGAIGWTWNNTDEVSAHWVSSIFPYTNSSANITTTTTLSSTTALTPTIPPTTASPSTTTSTATSTSTSTSSSTSPPSSSSSSSSSTSLSPTSTTSSDGFPIVGECGAHAIKDDNGRCACKSGYFKSGGSCKQTSTIVVAIIIPIIVVPIIVVILFFLWRSRKERQAKGPQRLPTRTMSLPELESNYESTNLITDFEAIVIRSRLGQGGSGVVNLGLWRHIEVAVKEFNNQDIQTTDFIRESEIHAKLRHPNVVQLLAICLPPHMCTISEYMAKGSLADLLQQKPTAFTWKRKLHALHDIAKGMDYLHKSKIIHRDLKSQNCLVDKNWNCKIADFGTSKLVGEANQTATAYVPRTAQWSAPEVIVRGEYSERSDVYSHGVIMWECLTGQIPYDGMFAFQVEDRTVKGSRLTIPVGADAWYESLMKACWSESPNDRPTFEEIIVCIEKAF